MKKIFNKKIKTVFMKMFCYQIIVCVLLCMIPIGSISVFAAGKYEGGKGTEAEPYLIANVTQLQQMAKDFNSNRNQNVSGYYKLTNDIIFNDTSDFDNWEKSKPANNWNIKGFWNDWNSMKVFSGTFDGDGHKIIGLYINNTDQRYSTGFFGAANGTVKNVCFEKSFVKGINNVGGIVGLATGNCKILNCSFSGVVNGSANYAGGIVGRYYGNTVEGSNLEINSCSVEGSVSAVQLVGGFLGDISSYGNKSAVADIISSYAAAYVIGTNSRTGGFIGRVNADNGKAVTNISKSHYYGTLSDKAEGTLVGSLEGGNTPAVNITDVYYNSEIIGGAANKKIQGEGKTTLEFSDKTVLNLLNNSNSQEKGYWEWKQGEKYPDKSRAHLNSLTINSEDFGFIPTVYEYNKSIAYVNETATIVPVAAYASNKIIIDGTVVESGKSFTTALEPGETKHITVKVEDSDGSQITYLLHITRRPEVKFAGGSGTENDPYLISNIDQLFKMAEDYNLNKNMDVGGHYKLTNDIVFNDTTNFENWETNPPKNNWEFKGHYSDWNSRKEFSGTFDGNGYKIIGLYVNNTDSNPNSATGFIAVGSGTVKNLHFEKSFVKGARNIGGIVGLAFNNFKLLNCSFSGVVKGNGAFAGGMIGRYYWNMGEDMRMVINSCSFEGSISSNQIIGGILGEIGTYVQNSKPTVDIINSYVVADVTGTDNRTGGLIGRVSAANTNATANIIDSYFYGKLNEKAGGTLVGSLEGNFSPAANVINTYYNSDIIGGANDKQIQGTGKSTSEFSDGTVTNLLNNSNSNGEAYWAWRQGKKYPINNRAHLNALTLSSGDFSFTPTVYEYSRSVTYENEFIAITPVAAYDTNKITVDGKVIASGKKSQNIDLEVGKTKKIVISVKDSDGSETTYVLNITRKSQVKYDGGNGTKGDPYLISNAEQLLKMADDFEKNDLLDVNICYKLTADIVFNDISDFENWDTQPPENEWLHKGFWRAWNKRHVFGGTFDGGGHKIIGLYINNQNDAYDTGFIGATVNAVIRDLHFEKSYIKGLMNTGGIVGQASYDTSIIGCSFSGVVESTGRCVGGIVGRYYFCMGDDRKLTIDSCHVEGKISTTAIMAGGILGNVETFADNCNPSVEIVNSYVAADVVGGDYRTGGIIGRDSTKYAASSVRILNSYYYGKLPDNAKGTIIGETLKNSNITYTDVYYNSDIIGGAADIEKQGEAKTTVQFSDGTVTDLLINSKAADGRKWDWRQGEKYPVEKRARLNGLTLSSGSFRFSLLVYDYKISLSNKIDAVALYPITAYDSSKITIDGQEVKSENYSREMALEPTVKRDVVVKVKDTDGSESTYILHITRRKAKFEPSVWDGTVAEDYEGGSGTQDDPYVIINAAQLAYFEKDINSGTSSNSGSYFCLENDIILNSDYANFENWGTESPSNVWTPISKYNEDKLEKIFKGSLEGNGHTIYGLYTDGSSGNSGTGLFGALNGGSVSNLNLKKSYIKADGYAGGVIGVAVGQTRTVKIFNVGFEGIIDTNGVAAGGLVGEIVTFPTGAIDVYSSYSHGKIFANDMTGGLIGYVFNDRTIGNSDLTIRIENSYSGMEIKQNGDTGDYFGGLLGCFSGMDEQISLYMRRSHFAGEINSSADNKGPILGGQEDEAGLIEINNTVYYAKESVAAPISNQFNAIGFERAKFADGTVFNLLSNVKRVYNSDLWNWVEGDKYPTAPSHTVALNDIVLSAGFLTFNPVIADYSVWVDKSVKSITLTPYAANSNSNITVNNDKVVSGQKSKSIALNGENATVITVAVTNRNGKKQTFTVRVYSGNYMLHFIQGNGIDNGEFGQEIKLSANKKHIFSFNYFVRTSNGLRPLVKYLNNNGEFVDYAATPQKFENLRDVNFSLTFATPNDAMVDSSGKVTYKLGLKNNVESVGYVTNLKLTEEGSNDNLFKNSAFKENFMNWIDSKNERYMVDNVFKGYLGEVELLPSVAEYFAEKPNDTNDEMFDDGDWAVTGSSDDDYTYDDYTNDDDYYDYDDGSDGYDDDGQQNSSGNKKRVKRIIKKIISNNTYIYIIIAAAAVVLVGAGVAVFLIVRKKRSKH